MDRAFAAPAPAGTWRVGVRLSIGEAAVAALCVATLCGGIGG